nr:tRNA (guanosine(37)-N1)-methyltransferase TrmD [Kofleriaceae bacterium]
MKFTVVTILPELIEPALAAGVVGRARDAGTISVATVNPRDFTHDRHRTVDDTPYGGGPGMVMKAEPLLAALDAAAPRGDAHRILLSPAGAPLTQARVRELATLPHVVLACGRYEGVDERAIELGIDEQISIGDYVLSGGELGALVIIDAVARFVPGVLGEAASVDDESHSAGVLEYPHYTRPPELAGHAVPDVLQSGNHAAIAAWRRVEALKRTAARRPDLWARLAPTAGDRKLLAKAGCAALPARTHVALVHHPVVDRTGAVVTTALTNFDVHDLARSAMTYGLAGYHVVTPITSQRDKAVHIAKLWIEDQHGQHRAQALQLVRVAASIGDAIADIGPDTVVVATSARPGAFPGARRTTAPELVADLAFDPRNVLLLFGTGWGLAEELIPSVSRVLEPIDAGTGWNHLSVRSAAAITLDRLFGRST